MNTIKFDPSPGTTIYNACEVAADMAKRANQRVQFQFNDVWLLATPDMSATALVEQWSRDLEERRQARENSPEGQAQARRDRDDVAEKQTAVDALIAALPDALATFDIDSAMGWVEAFTGPSDRVGVHFNNAAIVSKFEEAGYRTNAHVGVEPDRFTRRMTGEYTIGQVMNCLERGMPPHPICLKFCREYWAKEGQP